MQLKTNKSIQNNYKFIILYYIKIYNNIPKVIPKENTMSIKCIYQITKYLQHMRFLLLTQQINTHHINVKLNMVYLKIQYNEIDIM